MVAITQVSTTPVVTASPASASGATKPAPAPRTAPAPSSAGSAAQPSEQLVAQAVEASNNALINSKNESISFGYEKRLGLLYVQVTDKNTGEVIREIPSKDFIRHALALRESIGLILNKKG